MPPICTRMASTPTCHNLLKQFTKSLSILDSQMICSTQKGPLIWPLETFTLQVASSQIHIRNQSVIKSVTLQLRIVIQLSISFASISCNKSRCLKLPCRHREAKLRNWVLSNKVSVDLTWSINRHHSYHQIKLQKRATRSLQEVHT